MLMTPLRLRSGQVGGLASSATAVTVLVESAAIFSVLDVVSVAANFSGVLAVISDAVAAEGLSQRPSVLVGTVATQAGHTSPPYLLSLSVYPPLETHPSSTSGCRSKTS